MSSVNYSDDVVSSAVERYQQRQRQYSLQQHQQPVAWIMPRGSYAEEHVTANRGLDYNTLHGEEEESKGFGLWKSLLVILVLGLIVTNGFLLVGALKVGKIVEDSTVYDCRGAMQAIDCDGRNLFLSYVTGGDNSIVLDNCPSTGVLIVRERSGTSNAKLTWGGTLYTCGAGTTTTFLVISDSTLVEVAALQ
jgi:hypothetical protein